MALLITLSQVQANRLHYSKQVIILVTGVFDLLHAEHKKFLRAAKKSGDVLFVGVETDRRVRRLKGPGRPAWPLAKRLKQLARLPEVDYVFALPEQFDRVQDHETLVAAIRPDILAVSSQTPHQEVKKRLVGKYGGRLHVVLPHNPRISTSQLIFGRKSSQMSEEPLLTTKR